MRFLQWLICYCMISVAPIGRADGVADAVFQRLATLKGKWEAIPSDGEKSTPVTYDLASKDSVVTEFFGSELTVIYRDGPAIVLTHYCNSGSHPRLRLSNESTPQHVVFEFMDATNLPDTAKAHVHKVSYEFEDATNMVGEWTWKIGEKFEVERYKMKRLAVSQNIVK